MAGERKGETCISREKAIFLKGFMSNSSTEFRYKNGPYSGTRKRVVPCEACPYRQEETVEHLLQKGSLHKARKHDKQSLYIFIITKLDGFFQEQKKTAIYHLSGLTIQPANKKKEREVQQKKTKPQLIKTQNTTNQQTQEKKSTTNAVTH